MLLLLKTGRRLAISSIHAALDRLEASARFSYSTIDPCSALSLRTEIQQDCDAAAKNERSRVNRAAFVSCMLAKYSADIDDISSSQYTEFLGRCFAAGTGLMLAVRLYTTHTVQRAAP